jgi:hypothetical protein
MIAARNRVNNAFQEAKPLRADPTRPEGSTSWEECVAEGEAKLPLILTIADCRRCERLPGMMNRRTTSREAKLNRTW